MYDMEEHVTRFNEITYENRDDYIMNYMDYYHIFEREFDGMENPLVNRHYHDEVDDICFKFIKDNMSPQFLLKAMTCDGKELAMTLDKPIKVRTYISNGPEYKDKTEINYYDVQYTLQSIKEEMYDLPNVYIYGYNGDWEDKDTLAETFKGIPKGNKVVIVTRDEEC